MIELTDADRAAINAERVRVFVDLPAWERRYVNWDETLYRAGLSAGIERSAKLVEERDFIWPAWAESCDTDKVYAEAIRALLK